MAENKKGGGLIWPGKKSNPDPGSDPCRDQSILQLAAIEAIPTLDTQLPWLGASYSS